MDWLDFHENVFHGSVFHGSVFHENVFHASVFHVSLHFFYVLSLHCDLSCAKIV